MYIYIYLYTCIVPHHASTRILKCIEAGATHIYVAPSSSLMQAWVQHAGTRRIILNKDRESQVMNVQKKGANFISKSCIVIHLEMSEDPSQLKLRAGDGKVFRLALMQGVEPVKEVPKELDHVPGDTCTWNPSVLVPVQKIQIRNIYV